MLSYDIAMQLCALGKEVVVINPRPTRPLNYDFGTPKEDYPFEQVVLDSYTCPESKIIGRTWESYSLGRAVTRFIKHYPHPIDAIYANTWALFSQRAVAKAARRRGIPYFIHVQDIYPESYSAKLPKCLGAVLQATLLPIDKYVLRHAKKIFAIAPAMVSYLSTSRNLPKEKFILARNWQNDDTFIAQYKPVSHKTDVCRVMYLGHINPTANVTLIVRAVARLPRNRFHLSVIGNGPEKEHCEALGSELGLDITFGSVVPADVAATQSEADILVLCLKEGVAQTATPSKLTAYMLTGRPIIASVDLDSDCADIIRSTGCGLVVAPEDEQALSEALTQLAALPEEKLQAMGAAAHAYAKAHLSRASNLKKVTDALIEASAEKGKK